MFSIKTLAILGAHTLFANCGVVGLGAAMTDYLIETSEAELHAEQFEKGGWYEVSHDRFCDLIRKHSNQYEIKSGGSAVNVLKGIAGLEMRAFVVGRTGNDDVADFYNRDLLEHGVESHLVRGDLPSGQVASLVTPDGQRTFSVYFGASQASEPRITLDATPFDKASHLHIEGYQLTDFPTLCQAIAMAKSRNMTISLDLANQFVIKRFRNELEKVLPHIDILIGNEEETKELTGEVATLAISSLAKQCSVVVITLGDKGAIAQKGKTRVRVQAVDVPVVDTTGAGDGFTAGFLTRYLRGDSLEKCLEEGCYLASFVIQHMGAEITEKQWEAIKLRQVTCSQETTNETALSLGR